ncbi:hypothetical protein HGI30_21195 [Paenibacillus albicereus]|uniref:SLH domain-containing protein n=1 Tax=Paenibacillus albicereus TaxID=2726185 RepID=A0A6H2H290_9BACL|nr:Ig-like domain-containing protein [Paenibacillus albicereus]QJC53790.1 hypothetical protein HGI30_21195 [Paenibacillus albicereus]
MGKRMWLKGFVALLVLVHTLLPAAGWKAGTVYAAQGGPVAAGKYPADDAAAAPANVWLSLFFDEPVLKGNGAAAISIRKVSDNAVWASYAVSESRVAVDSSNASRVTIQPDRPFEPGQSYYVLIEGGSFVSQSGSGAFAGISSATEWNFTAAQPDTSAPYATEYSPNSGQGAASVFSALRVTFNEAVFPAEGFLQLTNASTGDTAPIGITSTLVSGGGTTVLSIAPPSGLLPSQSYTVSAPAGLVQDGSGNRSGPMSWSFQTAASPIGVTGMSPANASQGVDVGTALRLTFDKPVGPNSSAASPKRIELKKVSDNSTVQSWSADQLSYADGGRSVALPHNGLAGSTAYYVLVDAAAFRSGDLLFAGIRDAAAWTFATRAVSDSKGPSLTGLSPGGGETIAAGESKLAISFDRAVYPGSGSIIVRSLPDSAIAATIPVTSDQVTGFGSSRIQINPRFAFQEGARYYVEIGTQAVRDAAGTAFAGLSGSSAWSFTATRDWTPPSILMLRPASGSDSVSTIASFEAVFTEPVRLSDGHQIRIRRAGSSDTYAVQAHVPADRPDTVVIRPDAPLPGGGEYYMEIGVNSIRDGAGNGFGGILNEHQWRFKTLRATAAAPALSKVEMLSPSKIRLTYDNELDPAAVPYPASFYVTVNDASAAREISQASVAGNTVVLELRSGILNGQKVTVAYTAPTDPDSMRAIRGLGGARAAGFSGRQATYDAQAAQPKLTGGTVSGSQLRLLFSDALGPAKAEWTSQFSLYVDGRYHTLAEPSVSGNALTFKLTSAAGGAGGAYINYAPGTNPVMDQSGNLLAAFSGAYIQNLLDTSRPMLTDVTASGSKVTLTYNEGLNGTLLPLRSQFAVLNGSSSMSISGVTVEGNKLILTLAGSLTTGTTVKVSYVQGVPPLADLAGNAAESFSNREAGVSGTYPAFLSGSASGTAVTLLYSMALDPTAVPSPAQFSFRANGTLIPVSSVSISGLAVSLQLSSPVAPGQTLTLTYSPPTYNALRLSGGDAAPALSSVAIANASAGDSTGSGGGASGATPGQLTQMDVSTSSDVSPAGRVATRYTVLNERLAAAFQAARAAGQSKVSFKVPDANKAGLVALPLASLQQAMGSAGNASFEVQFDTLTVELPLQAIDYEKTAKLLNAGGTTGYLLLSLDSGASSLAGTLQFAMSRAGASLLAGPISIDLSLVSGSSAAKVAYSGLKRMMTTTIRSASPIPAAQAAGVFYDAETSLMSYVPTKTQSAGSGSAVVLKHRDGGVFAIARGSAVLSDIAGHWAKNDISALAAKAIVRPRTNSSFEPKKTITRAELAEFISRALGLKGNMAAASSAYRDTNGLGAAAAYIGAASAAGIVEGSGGQFRPNDPVSRQEMAAMIIRAVEAAEMKIVPPQQELSYLEKFKDRGKIGSWAKSYAAKAVYIGVLNGQKADQFVPAGKATRAEAVVMMKRMLQYLNMIDV